MQKLVAILLIAVLVGSVTIPNVFSDSENEQNTESDNNQNDNHENQNNAHENDNHENQNEQADDHHDDNDTKIHFGFSNATSNTHENENDNHENQNEQADDHHDDNDTKIHFGFSNATSVSITLPNGTTMTFGFSNGTNVGQQISSFIHQIREAFKHQENQAKQTIKDCREKARDESSPEDRKNIMNECKAKLKEINQQFRTEHKQLQLDFKQFREMVIGNNQENHEKLQEQKHDTKIQNSAQIIPKHEQEQKLGHGKQNEKKKRGRED